MTRIGGRHFPGQHDEPTLRALGFAVKHGRAKTGEIVLLELDPVIPRRRNPPPLRQLWPLPSGRGSG